jgi:F0F1-type ATP synthase membrane subunit b/b'
LIAESLKKPQMKSRETINLPISTIINLANKTLSNYIEDLNESDRNELNKILTTNENDIKESYQDIKENVLKKLDNLFVDSDIETKSKIEESINKIKSEKFDKLNYFRLKSLNENL